jgi:hypothetical protein
LPVRRSHGRRGTSPLKRGKTARSPNAKSNENGLVSLRHKLNRKRNTSEEYERHGNGSYGKACRVPFQAGQIRPSPWRGQYSGFGCVSSYYLGYGFDVTGRWKATASYSNPIDYPQVLSGIHLPGSGSCVNPQGIEGSWICHARNTQRCRRATPISRRSAASPRGSRTC